MALLTISNGAAIRDPFFAGFLVLVLALTASICLGVYRRYLHPLSHIPGPPSAALSGLWRNNRYWRGTWHDDIVDVHRKYGPVVRIAPNEVSVVGQTAMKQLYGHGCNTVKTSWYSVWDPPIGAPAFFSVRDRKLHSFLRKRVSAAYTMSSVLRYEVFIQGCLDLLINRLRTYATTGQTVDMSAMTNAFAFDVVGELAYGTQLGHLETGTDVLDLRKNIFNLFFLSSCMGHYLGQMKLFTNPVTQAMFKFCGIRNRVAEFQDWSKDKVEPRFAAARQEKSVTEGRSDMLAHFLKMRDQDGNPARFEEVLSEALNLVGAGADTTSIAIRACLEAIASRPDVCKRLQAEIDDYYTASQLTEPITYLQCQNLPYLLAVTKEAMRLWPSIVFQLLRHAPDSGMTIGDISIPAGTPVGMSLIAHNRDRGTWGEDADEFRPERWLESDERARYLESINMTFGGSGPRMCVGRNIALVEVQKSIAQIFRTFDVELVNKDKPWTITSYWFAYQHDLMMRLSLREKASQ
ncbi:Pisatin demethylase [Cyphellophora attinorum]|uniref:Pisatin demethylase n=1 Tax=Cyphellophora attinorum TaxID=1664694 RepID=A0A0N1H3V6_9EURO|nr:Pisatin demethylase [Phialophora attinorum]KPI39697.1 Pisatin demethylase [Phialophora attinorum]